MPLPVWSFSAAENHQPQSFQGRHLKSTQRHSSLTCFCLRALSHSLIALFLTDRISTQTRSSFKGLCVRKHDHLELCRKKRAPVTRGFRRLLIGNICAKQKGLSLCFASAVNYLLQGSIQNLCEGELHSTASPDLLLGADRFSAAASNRQSGGQ